MIHHYQASSTMMNHQSSTNIHHGFLRITQLCGAPGCFARPLRRSDRTAHCWTMTGEIYKEFHLLRTEFVHLFSHSFCFIFQVNFVERPCVSNILAKKVICKHCWCLDWATAIACAELWVACCGSFRRAGVNALAGPPYRLMSEFSQPLNKSERCMSRVSPNHPK